MPSSVILNSIAVVAALLLPGRSEVYLTEAEALKLTFPEADHVEKRLLALTPQERADVEKRLDGKDAPRVYKYWIGTHKGDVIGYAVIDDVMGKDQPITYMLSVDAKLVIRSVEILAYRESRGGEIRQADWRKQFEGTSVKNPLRVGSDIRNIAGATISCRSLTDGVRRQIVCLSVLLKTGARPAETGPGKVPKQDSPDPAAPTLRDPAGVEAVPFAAAPNPGLVLVRRSQLAMGTTIDIQAYAESREIGSAVIEMAFTEVARLESILSTWRADSEVSRLNRSAGGPLQSVSSELLELSAWSIEESKRTAGAFDIALGPLIEVWKRAAQRGIAPTAEELETARRASGSAGIQLDRARATLGLTRRGMGLDFGAVGKGFALDRAGLILTQHGVHSALLDFGGQFLALDPPPGETAWTVAVRDPARPDHAGTSIRLVHASIASSADYERGMAVGSKPISHIIDPRLGQPVTGMLGTSVVTPTATEADALSTALYVMGFEAAARYSEERGLASLIVAAGRVASSPGFLALEIAGASQR